MKNFSQILLLITGILVLLTTGCKKDTNSNSNNSQQISAEMNAKILRQIASFKSQMTSSLKDGAQISTDSAVWYITAVLNETYARCVARTGAVLHDTCTLSIPLTGSGTVSIVTVDTAYSQLLRNLKNYYDAISGDKSLYLVQVSIASATNDTAVVNMDFYIMKGALPNPKYNWQFGSTDYWVWGLGAGKCDIYSGQDIGQDASTQLALFANGALNLNSNIIIVDHYKTPKIYPWYVPTNSNPYGFKADLLYYHNGNDPSYNDCLDPGMMNYYLANLSTIAGIYRPYGKVTCAYDVHFDLSTGMGYWDHFHTVYITYGMAIACNNPPADL